MDHFRDELTPWVQVASALGEEGLATLASRGLLRRARKDLARTPPQVVEVGEHAVVQVAEHVVTLAMEPSRSQCTCPAEGACRHIIVAWMALALMASEVPSVPEVLPAVLALTDVELTAWAGALWRPGLAALAQGEDVEVREERPLVVWVTRHGVEVRWLGASPLETLCGCREAGPCAHRLLAILGLQVAQGDRKRPAMVTSVRAQQPVRSVEQLRQDVQAQVQGLLRIGLTRVGERDAARMDGLAAAAHGGDLPRLERLLRALGDVLRQVERRSASASSRQVLRLCAEVYALTEALKTPTSSRRGVHRQAYHRVPQLVLHGAGVEVFHTASGMAGVTVWLWCASEETWHSWTHARSVQHGTWSVERALASVGPWGDAVGVKALAGSQVRLSPAWRADDARLSGRESTGVQRLGASDPSVLPALTDWDAAKLLGARSVGLGLARVPLREGVVVLEPAQWGMGTSGAPGFDAMRQAWVGEVVDRRGQVLTLMVPWRKELQGVIRDLEAGWGTAQRVIARWQLGEAGLTLRPFAWVVHGVVISLGVERGEVSATETEEAPPPKARGRLELLLNEVEEELVGRSERGDVETAGHLVALQTLADVETCGLAALATLLRPQSVAGAGRVLRSVWAVQVLRRGLELQQAETR